MTTGVSWAKVLAFVGLSFAVSWGLDFALGPHLIFQARAALMMLVPAIIACVLRAVIFKEGFGDSGLRPHVRSAWRTYAAAYAIIPICLLCGFVIAAAVGLQHWAIQPLSVVLKEFGVSGVSAGGAGASKLPLAAVLAWAVASLTVFLPANMVFTFGEELGWRGYLLVRLAPLGRTKAAIAVGVIWGLWHAPLIAFDGYVYPGHPVAGVFLMLVLTTSLSVLLTWLRFASDSIWPGVLAHAAFNAQAELAYIALTPADSLLRPPGGVCALLPFIAVAVFLLLKQPEPSPARGYVRS